MSALPDSYTGRLGTFGIGLVLKKSTDYLFDFVAYPAALLYFGFGWGGLLMTVLSVGFNLCAIRAYDWAHRDFLLIETLKEMRSSQPSTAWWRFVAAMLKRGNISAFFILSWVEDPIVVTLYLREGCRLYNGLSKRDWMIFAASTITANLSWMLGIGSLLEFYRLIVSVS